MKDPDTGRPGFSPWLATAIALAGLIGVYLSGGEWPGALTAAGAGFVLGGALPLLRGIWRYVAVFLAATGGFVWLVANYVK